MLIVIIIVVICCWKNRTFCFLVVIIYHVFYRVFILFFIPRNWNQLYDWFSCQHVFNTFYHMNCFLFIININYLVYNYYYYFGSPIASIVFISIQFNFFLVFFSSFTTNTNLRQFFWFSIYPINFFIVNFEININNLVWLYLQYDINLWSQNYFML